MVEVRIEVGSIVYIEEQAAKAFAEGEPETANPYRAGSTSARIWGVFFDSCKRLSKGKPPTPPAPGDAK